MAEDTPQMEKLLGDYGGRGRNRNRLAIANQPVTVNKSSGTKAGLIDLNRLEHHMAQSTPTNKQIKEAVEAEVTKRMAALNLRQPPVAQINQMNAVGAAQKNTTASIKNLEVQVGQIAQQLSQRAPGSLPSSTVLNPRDHGNVNAVVTRSQKMNESQSSKLQKGESESSPTLVEVELEVRSTNNEDDVEALKKQEEPIA
ncbi:hypothetical protein TSUD_24460 [Trifolium subterraneum]|uniref:Uncharacterized protein n=1 Tax=Trifolium subterraneum TaxID=3900 RepID=A0A2Z6P9W4_TRISU|nr:hypothetical protein TSUD_24460 [Trifolium subterraneum]